MKRIENKETTVCLVSEMASNLWNNDRWFFSLDKDLGEHRYLHEGKDIQRGL